MSERSESSIRAAVADCLARCYSGHTPLGILAEFLGDLRNQGWDEFDVRKVESAVRKVLAGVMSDNESHGSQSDG